jgi:LmbE family N-acetylglucosaminyl deacetylase
MTQLVIAAHPDDEVLGCGGAIARAAAAGDDVYICILGEGITSRFAGRNDADPELIRALHARSREAGRLLGAREVFLHGLPDNRFDTVALLDVVKIIEQHVNELRPSVVYTQHGGDLNIDHLVTYRATLTATRPMQSTPVKAVYAYEVASSTEWAFQRFSPPFHPGLFVDIHETLERKIAAMQIYESETRAFPHPRSPEALRALARRWGTVVGVPAAEAFEVVREIR